MPADEREVLERIRAGDIDAVQTLFEEHKTRIYRVCLLYTDSTDDAKDVLQETFLRAYKSVGNFRGESSFTTWLTRIAINICLNLRRDRRRFRQILIAIRVNHVVNEDSPLKLPTDLYARRKVSWRTSFASSVLSVYSRQTR